MTRDDEELKTAKRGYKDAAREGNREEEARWANVVGDILKRKGEYVEALRWLRLDYEVSVKHLPQKQLLPTCQCLGELYLRLDRFKEALVYQKRHLDLAKESNDLIEQQRASTQLGRTYHEMFLRSENDHYAIRNAKKYFKLAMKLARSLKENPPCNTSSIFLKEYIDAYNNIGMLDLDLDNLDEAERILLQGLKICDSEEVIEDDDCRSRLHHNLGCLYVELREWGKAREHTERDIIICKRIGHAQGEAKGYINLGELHYRNQKYDEATRCYQKALDIAASMEDEDALVEQVSQNINTVKEATQVLKELMKDEQKLRKLARNTFEARGTANERKCLLEQNACLDSLIEKSAMIFAWPRHLEFAKRKKRVASELCDKEKLSDSFLVIGESYQKLRNFVKARKWYMKSWNVYRSIENLEGQALAKINIGAVLDSSGDWAGALQAFEEGYRIAIKGNLPSVQMSALDNMHYSHMIRFDNLEEARKLQLDIQNLKHVLNHEDNLQNMGSDYCSETETEGGGVCDTMDNMYEPSEVSKPATSRPNLFTVDESDDCVPLARLFHQNKKNKKVTNTKMFPLDTDGNQGTTFCDWGEASSRGLGKSCDNQQPSGRKRIRVVISDDEADEPGDMDRPRRRLHGNMSEDVITSDKGSRRNEPFFTNEAQDISHPSGSKDVLNAWSPAQIEESSYSVKSKTSNFTADNGTEFGSSNDATTTHASISAANGSRLDGDHVSGSLLKGCNDVDFNLPKDGNDRYIACKIGHDVIRINTKSCMGIEKVDIEILKVQVACMYYLRLHKEKRSKGLLPIIGHLKYNGNVLGALGTTELEDLCGNVWIEANISGWVPKRLMDLYIDSCENLSEEPNIKLLKNLYNLEVSEDEVIASDCGLQDISVSPFLHALQAHRTVAVLDISHNHLGNETMEKLQQIFTTSSQKYGGLTLDLHCNRLGPTALFQICECPVLFTRLEVLNLSENRLTDACSSYLFTILGNCKALYNLNIEQCSITSRTIQKVADALHDDSVLSHLSIGKNSPISGISMINLLSKLSSLKRFSELSLSGIRLNKSMVDGLCQLARSSPLSVLVLEKTYIGTDGAVKLTDALSNGPQELVKLDLSYCGLASHEFSKICTNIAVIGGVLKLNLGGNSIGHEGCEALSFLLIDSQCSLKSLILDKCHLGLRGIIRILQSLSGNDSLEELHLAENADIAQEKALTYETTPLCSENDLKVADSEEEEDAKEEPAFSDNNANSGSLGYWSQYAVSQLVQELSAAIESATLLQHLNLSKNGFPLEVVELLYRSWSSSSLRCSGSARKHADKDQKTVHFYVEGKRCCGFKACCLRD